MEPTDVVLRFLESVGHRSDAEFYLSLFRAEAKERFATICVDGPVITDALDVVALDLRFLATLGLIPIVVVGLFDAHDAHEQARLIQAKLKVNAEIVPDNAKMGSFATELARAGWLPIVVLNEDEDRFDRLSDFVMKIKTRKLIFLQRRGGLRQNDTLVPLVNLTTDFDRLSTSAELSYKQQTILREARRLVCERVQHKLTVAITSPLNVLRELFTVRGAGTLLRRGAQILSRSSLDDIDPQKLKSLLDDAFGRNLHRTFFEKPVARVYLEEDYRGAAVIHDTRLGAYLSKFAVSREAQGEGLGGDIWERVIADYPALFWRSRPDNQIDAWYMKQCDGMQRCGAWNVFWRHFPAAHIADAIAYALAQAKDFGEEPLTSSPNPLL